MVRPERFELPTPWFEAKYSIQLSYGRIGIFLITIQPLKHKPQDQGNMKIAKAQPLIFAKRKGHVPLEMNWIKKHSNTIEFYSRIIR